MDGFLHPDGIIKSRSARDFKCCCDRIRHAVSFLSQNTDGPFWSEWSIRTECSGGAPPELMWACTMLNWSLGYRATVKSLPSSQRRCDKALYLGVVSAGYRCHWINFGHPLIFLLPGYHFFANSCSENWEIAFQVVFAFPGWAIQWDETMNRIVRRYLIGWIVSGIVGYRSAFG